MVPAEAQAALRSSSDKAQPGPMLTLHTLGGLHVARDDEAPLGGAAAQRRLLALLAILAVAGERGLSRDKILALLWPEGDPEKTRHSLTQSLYHARRALGHDDLFVGTTEIRINPDRLTSDLHEFERAVAAGELERAASVYGGPFLDGFFLTGSREFEDWSTAQRARVATMMSGVLDRLADSAEATGALLRAIEWRKRRFALDPLDSAAAARLITAMAAGGDRAGALQQARVHEVLLREQLDLAPDATVLAVVQRLRNGDLNGDSGQAYAATRGAPTLLTAAPSVTPPSSPLRVVTPQHVRRDPAATNSEDQQTPRPLRRRLIAMAASVMALTTVLAVAIVGVDRRQSRATAATPPATMKVLVAPFRVGGADASLGYLRDGMVELLSTRLAGDSLAHAVDPGAVLSAWRAADAANLSQRDVAVRAARRLGAAHAVVGSIVGTGTKLMISAALVVVRDGSIGSQTTVEGPADSLTALVDRLAARLLAAQAGEGERLAEYVTPSLPSLRAFLAGQRAYRDERYTDAVHHYEYALHRDSSFALAALQLALAADRLNDAEQHDRALALAWAAREELTERDRAHLIAFAGPRYPAPSSEAEQLAAWQRAVALAPDRADVWNELGERFFYHGPVLGLPDAHRRAAAAFRRALSLDPDLASARRLLILLAASAGDSDALNRVASRAALRDSVGELAPFLRWRVAVARGDASELRRIRAELPRLDDANLRAVAVSSQFDGVALDDGERALRIRRARATRTATLIDVLLGQHSMAVARGKPILALDVIEQVQELQPGSRAHLRLRVLDALYAEGDGAAAANAAKELARVADEPASPADEARAERLADLCVLEQWRLAAGDTRSAPTAVERLRSSALPRVLVPVSANPLACAELLDAMLAVGTSRPDAAARVMRLDSLMLGGPAVSDAGTYAHLAVARLYERLGEPHRALAAIRRRTHLTGWPRYLVPARREEGRLAEAVGDRDGARAAYRFYLRVRTNPEGTVAPQVAAVRVALARLPGEPRPAGGG